VGLIWIDLIFRLSVARQTFSCIYLYFLMKKYTSISKSPVYLLLVVFMIASKL
jgi:hypothetical protein